MLDDGQERQLNSERSSLIEDVFERALVLPEASRSEFIRRACNSDSTLINDVYRRLQSYRDRNEWSTTSRSNTNRPDPRIGIVLKRRFRVQRQLGTGGLGIVYVAEDLNLMNRPVVVKFLLDYGEPDPSRLRKFRQEIEALARIDHPGVVTAFDAGETDDSTPFLVMQYVEGETLRTVIDRGPLALDRAASVIRQLGEALQAAHDKRIIHRDLKPENIMLQELGSRDILKLIDFGVARVEESRAGGDTAVLTVAGTPSYMAPEQLSGRPEMASDIFALGVIAFEMLTGKRPFPSRHPYQLRQQHRNGIPRGTIRKARPEVPPSVEASIRRALAFEPQDRPSSAKEWCSNVADSLLRPRIGLSRRSLVSGAGLVVLVGAGAATWFLRDRGASVSHRGPILAEHVGALDPFEEGFRVDGKIAGSAVRNATHTGFDRWRLEVLEQGSYHAALTMEEKRQALRRGWKMTLSAYPEIGGIYAVVDFHGVAQRFDVSLYREADGRLMVKTCTQHVPVFAGPERELSNAPHRCELSYDPVNAACELYVDGIRLSTGYQGHSQQQKSERGFFFGASVWKSNRAEGTVDLARFELL